MKGSGKVGNTVISQNGGATIAREYNPNVANPSTASQVEKRSAFKLASQLSASLKSSIAIRKDGLKSGRNQFMSINKSNITVNEGVASINLNKVQLTKSNTGLPEFSADRTGNTAINVEMQESAINVADRMVYAGYQKMDDGSLVAFDSVVVSTPGADGKFAGSLAYTDKAVVIYAYGIKDATAGATAAFGNMVAPTAEQVAKLLTTSSEVAANTNVTKTKGLTMLVGETSGDSDAEEHFVVSVSKSGNGSVSGGGRFVAGQIATLTATPDAEASFVAWKRGSVSGETLSTNATYSFEVTGDITIVGVFQGGPTPKVVITASVDPVGAGTVSGGGEVNEGSQVTLQYTPAAGSQLVLDGWYRGQTKISSANPYTFTATQNENIIAKAVEPSQEQFSNVTLDGTAVNQNATISGSTATIAGNVTLRNGASKVFLVRSENKPTAGTDCFNSPDADVTNSSFSKQFNTATAGKYWLCSATYDLDSEQAFIVDVFEFYMEKQ